MARVIGIVTTARSDFGCLRPLMQTVRDHPDLTLRIYIGGSHFSDVNGRSCDEVEAEFGAATVRVPCTIDGDRPLALGRAMGEELAGFSAAFDRARPDILVVLGDRWDMIPAVLAALPFNIPVAHLSGGEITEGVIDDALRHAVTKLSHLHFPACEEYGRRLRRMGEEPWRIHVTGEPGLDSLAEITIPTKAECFGALGFDPDRPLSLVTQHPETIGFDGTAQHIGAVLAAAARIAEDGQILFTHPNTDTGSAEIITALHRFVADHPGTRIVPSLGRQRFFAVLAHCDALVGNSSAGLVEAASFKLPVVNVGQRQTGRIAPANVVSVPAEADAVLAAWRRALSPAFRAGLTDLVNPYGDGHAAPRITDVLATVAIDRDLLVKRFVDGPSA
jgi:UDP-hydrolysing UDP-N-acetyl-D-glucosamine 2-epimerase